MIMHLDVTTVGPPERLKRLAESRRVPLSLRIVRAPHPYRDLPFRPVLLRARRERPRSCAAEECDEVTPSHANCPSGQSLPKGGVVRHSKIGGSMTAVGHQQT